MPFLTRLLAAVGAVAIAVGVFVPYAGFDIGHDMEYVQIIDLDEPSYFYTGLDLLIAAIAAAAIPFLLRNALLCGWLLIALGGLSATRFFTYVLAPLRGGEDEFFLRPGGIVGLVGALLVVAAGVVALRSRTAAPTAVAPSYGAQRPAHPPSGWYPDPSGSAAERYWDGTTWGNETR